MEDFKVNGRCITAESKYEARRIFEKKYGPVTSIAYWDYQKDGEPGPLGFGSMTLTLVK